MNEENLAELARSCDEFLVHGVDVEGKQLGVDRDLIELLGKHASIPTTYAGGVQSMVSTMLAPLASVNPAFASVRCWISSCCDKLSPTMDSNDEAIA